jgi:DNA-binding MarR family transcriptional regulator
MTAADRADESAHPRHRLDPVIHSPVRLSIVACLAAAERAEFGFVRDTVEVSDSVLSKQVSNLDEVGYVKVKKGYVGKFPRTWLSLTPAGRRAFDAHLGALAAIVSPTSTPNVALVEPAEDAPLVDGR